MVADGVKSVREPGLGHPFFPMASKCHGRDSEVVMGCCGSLSEYLSVSAKRMPHVGCVNPIANALSWTLKIIGQNED